MKEIHYAITVVSKGLNKEQGVYYTFSHHRPICDFTPYKGLPLSHNKSEVTCKRCLALIKKES